MELLEVNNLKKIYTSRFGINKVEALKNINFSVDKGEYVAIMGESGSGKTTLLNILATIDKATAGNIKLDGEDILGIKESSLAKFRREHLGFVFQECNLLDTFSVEDNIYLPLVLEGKKYDDIKKSRLDELASKLGISDVLTKFPYELSGGQKQKVAIARAIITNPKIILADEPTGALDSKSADELLRIFENLHNEGHTIIMVTHSVKAASHAQRVLFIRDGEIYHQLYKAKLFNDEMYKRISDTLTVLLAGGDNNE